MWEIAVVEHDTIFELCFQDLAHALKDQFLELGGHGEKQSLSHERDNAFDTGSVLCTVFVPFVLEEILNTQPLVGLVITVWAISLGVESSEDTVICSRVSPGDGTHLPMIPSVPDVKAAFEYMLASAGYTRETLR